MENKNAPISLNSNQESFVKLANEEGFTTEITRQDIISLQGKHGIKKPAWLMKNTAYRIGRASYSLPTLGQTMESTTENSDSE
jgi:hypothetical protein|tara:strand:- start:3571 stop:3819 length:249 start_codon:yes stop_codon:yes gene_type:complete